MTKSDPHHERFKAICLSFPETTETFPWGSPHFRVGEKIFAGYGGEEDSEVNTIGSKLDKEVARALVEEESRASPAKYVGKHGWISFELRGRLSWRRIEAWVEESYRLIAPKRLVKALDETS